MATWQGVDINTGAVELPKYNANGATVQEYIVAVTTALANGDTLYGPVIQAGDFVWDVVAAPDSLDSAGSGSLAFEVGFINQGTTTAAAFIASGNTTGQAGGVAHMNVPGGFGAHFTSNTTVAAVITAGAGTAVAGNFRLGVITTASP